MVNKQDLLHIQMTEVPKLYFTTIKERSGHKLSFYDSLLQITVRSNGIIYDLDSKPFREVDSIESIDQIQNTDSIINSGFIMSTSQSFKEDDSEIEILRRTQIFTNEYVNLIFEKK